MTFMQHPTVATSLSLNCPFPQDQSSLNIPQFHPVTMIYHLRHLKSHNKSHQLIAKLQNNFSGLTVGVQSKSVILNPQPSQIQNRATPQPPRPDNDIP